MMSGGGNNTQWEPLSALSEKQREQLAAFEQLLLDLNCKINLISRDTEAHFAERHILHALALTQKEFPVGSRVVDWGTGGGLPAIPLAICFPDVAFFAVDAVGKKIQAVRTMARRLGLNNLETWHGRAEKWPGSIQYSVSRATAPLRDLWSWHTAAQQPESADSTRIESSDAHWKPGLICLKGGHLAEEIAYLQAEAPTLRIEKTALRPLRNRPYFENKYLLEIYWP